MFDNGTIYFDHAATSWPKPPSVVEAMVRCMEEAGANPGRSAHTMSVDAARIIFEAREEIADFFGMDRSTHVVFTANATHALNIGIHGLVPPEGHVVTTSIEHNSVMRPLSLLRDRAGVSISCVPADDDGFLDLDRFEEMLEEQETSMVVAVHGCNVNGVLNPIPEMGRICQELEIPFLVDAAQTAGSVPINIEDDHIDLLAFTGHKSMMGPQGTGVLCANIVPESLYQGGTGSRSEHQIHPDFMPDRLEAGTPNTVGIAGLLAGIELINEIGISNIARHEERLKAQLVAGLEDISGLRVYSGQLPVVSFTIEGISPSDIGYRLDNDFGILTRVGLHCSPAAHERLGTLPIGTVRMSLGYSNTADEVSLAIKAVESIASGRKV